MEMMDRPETMSVERITLIAEKIQSALLVDDVEFSSDFDPVRMSHMLIASFKAFWWEDAEVNKFPQAAFTYDTVWGHFKGAYLGKLVEFRLLSPPKICEIRQQFFLCPHLPSPRKGNHIDFMTQGKIEWRDDE